MTRFLIAGLIVLAVFLPLVLPPAIFTLDIPLTTAGAVEIAGSIAQSAALLAPSHSRAPPSR